VPWQSGYSTNDVTLFPHLDAQTRLGQVPGTGQAIVTCTYYSRVLFRHLISRNSGALGKALSECIGQAIDLSLFYYKG
jgi:hypothetical protein